MSQVFAPPCEIKQHAWALAQELISRALSEFLNGVDFYDWARNEDFLRQREIEWFIGSSKVCFWDCFLEDWVIKVGLRNLSMDYAEVEYNAYLKAKKCELEQYFPITIFLGELEGVKFYLQQRAECAPEQVHSKLIERVSESEGCRSYTLAGYVVEDLEAEDRIMFLFEDARLANFILSNDINDLHEGNFGYVKGQLVIIDFSGWRG